MTVTIHDSMLRDIFGSPHVRSLLLQLVEHPGPIRYSEARRRLKLHPQQFQRALDRLEDHGLVGLLAPDDANTPHGSRRYPVYLEPTALGRFYADLWDRMNSDYLRLAREREIPERALLASGGDD